MENKIETLIGLAREYFDDNSLTVNFNIYEDKCYVEVGNCEWGCKTFENGIDQAIKDIGEWFEEDNQEEWKTENEIAKAVENL
ncbi:MAG: hypothetical protein MR995_04030 [Fusobacterium mortiferum]|nr:hypothetical protein [Fusobacterium mortiferum]